MSGSFSVYGISTGLLVSDDDILGRVISSLTNTDAKRIEDGDILLFAESPLSTTEGRNINLDDITPSTEAHRLAEKYSLDPRLAEVVLDGFREAIRPSSANGGWVIPGYLRPLTRTHSMRLGVSGVAIGCSGIAGRRGSLPQGKMGKETLYVILPNASASTNP